MPRVFVLAFLALVLGGALAAQTDARATQEGPPLGLTVLSRHYQSPFRFEISEAAHVAVFRIEGNRVRLVFPFLGPDLRHARFAGEALPREPETIFSPGVHVIPRDIPGNWSARSENKTLPHDHYLLVVASRSPLRFEGLNRLLKVGRSMGFVERDVSVVLARAIVPDPDSDDWAAYLHWIR